MIKSKKGYTLAEVLIVLALLGILAAILLPAVVRVRPDREKMMFKKAYHTIERVVYELVNDEDLYPSKEGEYKGFDNLEAANYNGNTYSGNTKFCGLFAQHVNTTSDVISCSDEKSTYEITTTDGIVWDLPISNFSDTVNIYVHINGSIMTIKLKPNGKMYVEGTKEQNYLKSNKIIN